MQLFYTNPDSAPLWLQTFNMSDVSSCENDFLSTPVDDFPLRVEHVRTPVCVMRVCACTTAVLTSCPSRLLRAPNAPTWGLTWSSVVVNFSWILSEDGVFTEMQGSQWKTSDGFTGLVKWSRTRGQCLIELLCFCCPSALSSRRHRCESLIIQGGDVLRSPVSKDLLQVTVPDYSSLQTCRNKNGLNVWLNLPLCCPACFRKNPSRIVLYRHLRTQTCSVTWNSAFRWRWIIYRT